MKHLLSFTLLILVTSLASHAQSLRVQGKVIDSETKKGVAYATIEFKQFPSEETTKALSADIDGTFVINVPLETYNINISAMGYKTASTMIFLSDTKELEKGIRYIELKEVELEEQPIELGEVVIKPLVEVSADEIVYNLNQDPDREHSTLHEILDKVPMVGRTPDNKLFVEMPGTSFLVVRNGKEDALFTNNMTIDQILKTIPAKTFRKVTVMLAPPERYGGYKYVLNIETDERNMLFGVVGEASSYTVFDTGKSMNGVGGLGNLEKLRFYAGGGYIGTYSPKERQLSEQRDIQNGNTLFVEQIKRNTESSGMISGTFSYDLGKQHFITGGINHTKGREKYTDNNSSRRIIDNVEERYNIYTLQRNRINNFNANINYQYDFTGRERVLNIAYKAIASPTTGYSKPEIDGELGDLTPPYSSDISNHTKEQTVQVHYFDPISNALRLESGASYIYRDYYTNTEYYTSDDLAQNTRVTYMESKKHIVDVYASLRYSKKRISASAKLNAYYLNDGKGTRMKDLNGNEEYISETGLDIIPSAYVAFSFPNKFISRVSLRYNYRKNNPNIKMLSSNIDYSNPNLLVVGNPALKKNSWHTYSINTTIKKIPINLSYSNSGNSIGSYWYKNEDNILVKTYRNYGKSESYLINTMIPYYKGSFNASAMFMGSYSKDNPGDGNTSERIEARVSLNTGYTFKNKLSISVGAHYNYMHNSGYYGFKIPPFSVDLNAQKSFFNDKLEIEVSLSDITKIKSKNSSNVNTDQFTLYQVIEKRRIPLTISARYSFGTFKVKPIKQARQGAVINDVME